MRIRNELAGGCQVPSMTIANPTKRQGAAKRRRNLCHLQAAHRLFIYATNQVATPASHFVRTDSVVCVCTKVAAGGEKHITAVITRVF